VNDAKLSITCHIQIKNEKQINKQKM